jgi:hypothetical protein
VHKKRQAFFCPSLTLKTITVPFDNFCDMKAIKISTTIVANTKQDAKRTAANFCTALEDSKAANIVIYSSEVSKFVDGLWNIVISASIDEVLTSANDR